MDEARDDVYCHLTARRCVATAALRLGLERMSEASLDALAGVLIAYLERIGQGLAASVEASGRSSAHVNLWDCLRAVELCTEPAVQRVHLAAAASSNGAAAREGASNGNAKEENDNAEASSSLPSSSPLDKDNGLQLPPREVMSWKGLAAFCFGPQWSEPMTEQELNSGAASMMMMMNHQEENGAAAGGKVGPSALVMDNSNDFASNNNNSSASNGNNTSIGWQAPFPDEIPAFPTTFHHSTANPVHPSLASTADSLHDKNKPATGASAAANKAKKDAAKDDKTDKDDDDLTDAVFQIKSNHTWGEIGGVGAGTKRKRDGNDNNDADKTDGNAADTKAVGEGRPTKRKKANDGKAGAATTDPSTATNAEEEEEEEEDESHPSYVPRHFPSFPRHRNWVGPIIADDEGSSSAGNNNNLANSNGPAQQDGSKKSDESGTKAEATTTTTTTTSGAASSVSPKDEAMMIQSTLQVRSALVKLGRPWGAMTDDHHQHDKTTATLAVPPPNSQAGQAAPDISPLQPSIVPLGRASGSRPCRIMEGSMDSFTT